MGLTEVRLMVGVGVAICILFFFSLNLFLSFGPLMVRFVPFLNLSCFLSAFLCIHSHLKMYCIKENDQIKLDWIIKVTITKYSTSFSTQMHSPRKKFLC